MKWKVQLKHTGTIGMEHISIHQPVQYGFLECCTELSSFRLQMPVDRRPLEKVPECCKYGTGYIVPYFGLANTKHIKQMPPLLHKEVSIRMQEMKLESLKLDKKEKFSSASYGDRCNCYRVGQPYMKPEINNPVKWHNAPGSFQYQYPAEIYMRLLVTACGIHLLEVMIPNTEQRAWSLISSWPATCVSQGVLQWRRR